MCLVVFNKIIFISFVELIPKYYINLVLLWIDFFGLCYYTSNFFNLNLYKLTDVSFNYVFVVSLEFSVCKIVMHHITDTKFYFFLPNLDVFSNIFLPHFLCRISNTILNERIESADVYLALYLQKKKKLKETFSLTIKYNVAVAFLLIIFIR